MTRRAAGAASILILILAGCGRGTLSTPQLRSRAGRICQAASARTRVIPAASYGHSAQFLGRGVAALRPALVQLGTLHPSGAAAGPLAGAESSLSAELVALTHAQTALRHGADPVATFGSLQRHLSPLEARADGDWRSLDVPACLDP